MAVSKMCISTIKHVQKYDLGCIRTRPRYCQLVRVANREKRLAWCRERIQGKDNLDNQEVRYTCS